MQTLRFCFFPLISVFLFTGIFTCFRLFEILYHRSWLLENLSETGQTVLSLFFLDFLFFLLWNGSFILFHILTGYYNIDLKFKKRQLLFWTLNIPLLILFIADMQTLAVTGKLINKTVLSAFKIEILLNAHVLLRDYWFIALLFVTGAFCIVRWLPLQAQSGKPKNKWLWFGLFQLMGWLCVYGSFVTLSHKSKKIPNHVYKETSYNGMYFRLFHLGHINSEHHYFSKKRVQQILNSMKQNSIIESDTKSSLKSREKSWNIILIVIESFGFHHLTKHNTPFLYSLSKQGLFLKNHVSFTLSTQESMMSILNGFVYSDPTSNRAVKNSPFRVFLESGWQTFFFWGDKEATYFFDSYLKKMGNHHYITAENYLQETNKTKDTGLWGDIHEKPFMLFSAQKLKSARTPFLAMLLTNEPHYPFDCPALSSANKDFPDSENNNTKTSDNYKKSVENNMAFQRQTEEVLVRKKIIPFGYERQKATQKKFHHCLRYVDQSVKEFFEDIKTTPWFDNTLFVVTGDHISFMNYKKLKTSLRKYRLPLLFFSAGEDLKKYQNRKISSHTDILPSILDFTGLPVKGRLLLTNNFIFRPHRKSKLIYFAKDLHTWFLMDGDYLLEYSVLKKQARLWKNQSSSDKNSGKILSSHNKKQKSLNEIKSTSIEKWHKISPSDWAVANMTLVENDPLRRKYEEQLKAYIQYSHYEIW